MNNTAKIIIHLAALFGLIYLWSVDFYPAQYILAIYLLALFFEPKTSAYCFLFFIFLLPFFIYYNDPNSNYQMVLAEHYAVSGYIFLSGCVVYTLARENKFMRNFFTISYSQAMHILTKEKIFQKESYCEKFDQTVAILFPLAIFVFLLLSPLFNFLLIKK